MKIIICIENTKDIIKTLKEYDCNATFFVLGNKVEAYQDIIKESIKNGNEIGNHSYNHKWLSRLSVPQLTSQIEETEKIMKDKLNYKAVYLRPTYGSVTNRIRNNTNFVMYFIIYKTSCFVSNNI